MALDEKSALRVFDTSYLSREKWKTLLMRAVRSFTEVRDRYGTVSHGGSA